MDENKHSLISVIMGVYNGQRYLRESVESILNQTFTDFEFIIIDDGSTDSTRKILNEYAAQDSRIVLVHNETNIGLTKSLNKGLTLSQGEYIARQDADDVSLPERLERQVEFLGKYPNVALVSTNIEYINAEGRYLLEQRREGEPDLVAWYLLFYNHLGGHSQVVFRRKTVANLGGYNESYRYSQDHELWLRIAELGRDIVILPEFLLLQRHHGDSISNKTRTEQEDYSLRCCKQAISRLLAEEVNQKQINELRSFWLGGLWAPFPNACQVDHLHAQIKRIYQTFLLRRSQQGVVDSNLPDRLRVIIGQRFLSWLSTLSLRHELFLKLRMSFYAFAWHPSGLINYWLSRLQGKLQSVYYALGRHVDKKMVEG